MSDYSEGERSTGARQLPSLKPPRPSDSVSAEVKFPSFSDSNRKASRFGLEQTVILETPTILLTTLEINPVQSIVLALSDWPDYQGNVTVTAAILEPGPAQSISIY